MANKLSRHIAVALACAGLVALPGVSVVGAPQQVIAQETVESPRRVLDFNTDWLYVKGDDPAARKIDFNESSAERVSLPHAREAYDLYQPDIKRVQTVDWYRRHFTLPKSYEGERVIVNFNGGGQVNRVYVNGALVGEAKGTFTHFSFDITDYVTFGDVDNVISVQVDSRYHSNEMPPGNSIDFHYFGGLHGQASMTIAHPVRSGSIFYYNDDVTKGVKSATLNGKVDVVNDTASEASVVVRSIVRDESGAEVASKDAKVNPTAGKTSTVEFEQTIQAPHLWSCDDPYLYEVETQVLQDGKVVDVQKTNIGLRTFKTTKGPKESGARFTLNGEQIDIVGGNRHMQVPYLGNALTDKLNARDAELLKHDLGVNFVRTSHYENDPAFLDACDRLGILVEEEPLGWNDTPGWEQFVYSSDEMVKRDRNHPSIVMWGIVPNERQQNFPSVEETQKRHDATKALDPSRLTIQEEDKLSQVVADVWGWHDYNDPANGKNPVKKPTNGVKSWFVTEWNTNLGKHFVVPGDSETRKINQVYKDGEKMKALMSADGVMGTLKWDLFGYLTPNTNYERAKNVGLLRCAGVYDHWRDPLHKTWMANLMAAQAPSRKDVGDIVFINSEWKSNSPKKIAVTTNLDRVELYFFDGKTEKKIGELDHANVLPELKHGLYEFDVKNCVWGPDTYLLAKGYKKGSDAVCAQHKVTASTYDVEKSGAQLAVHNTMGDVTADGADVAWLLAELKDKNGQREFYGDEQVRASIVSGPGELVYPENSLVMADGLSGVYLRSEKDKVGTTKVKMEADLGRTLDDSDASIRYGETGWSEVGDKVDCWGKGYHQGDSGAEATISFEGTRLYMYAESSPEGGSASIKIDGKPAGEMSCKNSNKYGTIGNVRVYESPVLPAGTHTLEITAKGKVNIDRIKVFDGAMDVAGTVDVKSVADTDERVACDESLPQAPAPEQDSLLALQLAVADAQKLDVSQYDPRDVAKMKDALLFAESVLDLSDPQPQTLSRANTRLREAVDLMRPLSIKRINHDDVVMEDQQGGVAYSSKTQGIWVHEAEKTYAKKGRSEGDNYTITFEGNKIELFTNPDTAHGIAGVKIDDEPEVEVDLYRSPAQKNVMFWSKSGLSEGVHKVTVRVTGKTSGNKDNACVSFGYANIYTKDDPVQLACVDLSKAIESGKKIDRTKFAASSLQVLDDAIFSGEDLLRSDEVTADVAAAVAKRIEDAKKQLSAPGEQADKLVTCLDSDKAGSKGETGKVYYHAASSGDWVLEGKDSEAKRNRYLKKNATSQADTPYAELVFTGTGVEVLARHSSTSGMARVELRDMSGKVLETKEHICLYDAAVTSLDKPGTRSVYVSKALPMGTYAVRLYPENRAAEAASDKTLTSVNFAGARVSSKKHEYEISTDVLAKKVKQVNEFVLESVHPVRADEFKAAVASVVKVYPSVLESTYSDVAVPEKLAAHVTQAQIDRAADLLGRILDYAKRPLSVAEVSRHEDIRVAFGTPRDRLPLPETVRVTTSESFKVDCSVRWSCESYDSKTPGSYLFTGELEMPAGLVNDGNKTAELTVIVSPSQEPAPNPGPESGGDQGGAVDPEGGHDSNTGAPDAEDDHGTGNQESDGHGGEGHGASSGGSDGNRHEGDALAQAGDLAGVFGLLAVGGAGSLFAGLKRRKR